RWNDMTWGESLHLDMLWKCSASNVSLGAKDHASTQMNMAEVDKDIPEDLCIALNHVCPVATGLIQSFHGGILISHSSQLA
uniref:Uncharacterized protein n=1 Tax=Rhinolophus ferrumequinum TaxID=59479 RepID=A0A671FRQ6_RHIFE